LSPWVGCIRGNHCRDGHWAEGGGRRPTGGPDTAHQIVNDSGEDLAYISVSTMMPAEVCEYPDSGKIGAFGGAGDDRVRQLTRRSQSVDYWDGE
jgi:uncharacterized cupin superfamily protein